MKFYDREPAIKSHDLDSDGKRARQLPHSEGRANGVGPAVRGLLADSRILEPLGDPRVCLKLDFRTNARRNFTLCRAFVLCSAFGIDNATEANRIVYAEYTALVEATVKSARERTAPINNSEHARQLWVKRPCKAAWNARTESVKVRAFFFDVVETMAEELDAADSERWERRRNSVRRELCKNRVTFSTT